MGTEERTIPESDDVSYDASTNNVVTVIDNRDDALYEVNQIHVEYPESATTAFTLEFHDEPDGTAAGNLADLRKTAVDIQPGEARSYTGLSMRSFEDDVVVNGDQNGDATARVYVDGEQRTVR